MNVRKLWITQEIQSFLIYENKTDELKFRYSINLLAYFFTKNQKNIYFFQYIVYNNQKTKERDENSEK